MKGKYRKLLTIAPKYSFDENMNFYKMGRPIKKGKENKYIVLNRKIYIRSRLVASVLYNFDYNDKNYVVSTLVDYKDMTISDMIVYRGEEPLNILTADSVQRDGIIQQEETKTQDSLVLR